MGKDQRFISVSVVHREGDSYRLMIAVAGAYGHAIMTPYISLPYNMCQINIEWLSPDEMLKIANLIQEQAILAKYTTVSGG